MKDDELPFDHKSHVLYSKPCKKEILAENRPATIRRRSARRSGSRCS